MDETAFDEYVDSLLGGEPSSFAHMRDAAIERGLPEIQIPYEVSRLLRVLVLMTAPRRVLEIGTLFGYSAITIAGSLPPDGELVTLELDPHRAQIARSNIDAAGFSQQVQVIEGPALDSLAEMDRQGAFDFIFIDADKASYPKYLDHALRLVRKGGVILADNVWRDGAVMEPVDENARGAAEYNRRIAADPALSTAFVPSRDGRDALSISVVKTE